MNQLIWYDEMVVLKASKAFDARIIWAFASAMYGDSRIETIRAILLDLSECAHIRLTEHDAVTAGAIASAVARYTQIPRVAAICNDPDFRPIAQIYIDYVARFGRQATVHADRHSALACLGLPEMALGSGEAVSLSAYGARSREAV